MMTVFVCLCVYVCERISATTRLSFTNFAHVT